MTKSSTTCSDCNNYQARDLTLEICGSITDQYKLWKAYDSDGAVTNGGSGCITREDIDRDGAVYLAMSLYTLLFLAF